MMRNFMTKNIQTEKYYLLNQKMLYYRYTKQYNMMLLL